MGRLRKRHSSCRLCLQHYVSLAAKRATGMENELMSQLWLCIQSSHTRLQIACQMGGYSKCEEHEFTTRTGNRSPISSLTSPSMLADS